MIKIITDSLPDMPTSASGVRISSLYESYGCKYNFLRFYMQTIDNKCAAIISVMDGQASVCKVGNTDDGEILRFISVIGANTLYAEYDLPLETIESGRIMHKISRVKTDMNETIDFKRVYSIMSTAFSMPDFSIWYPDISHRVRHGCAKVIDESYGCAVALKSRLGALITGICVTENECRKGCGSRILNNLTATLQADDIFALVENSGPINFYETNGFSMAGKFGTYKVK